ncbi:hypothetical protein GUJ93_ZPchr0009g448 [Zizania palustris]|uniref:Uncharacterized protein n=1 Tax=Zizania palustris TaxID=103762 RepID=A0A8J5UXG1_ZIZPA|nr:hypothetical protein GUJ93_ZPchr0009g448 [Zizania palustris]
MLHTYCLLLAHFNSRSDLDPFAAFVTELPAPLASSLPLDQAGLQCLLEVLLHPLVGTSGSEASPDSGPEPKISRPQLATPLAIALWSLFFELRYASFTLPWYHWDYLPQ